MSVKTNYYDKNNFPLKRFPKDVYLFHSKFAANELATNLLSDPTMKRNMTRRATIKSFETPIQTDILQNLPQFCFPRMLFLQYFNSLFVNIYFHSECLKSYYL